MVGGRTRRTMASMRASRLGLLLAVVLLLPAGTAEASLTDAGGQPVAATDWSSTSAQVVGDPGCAAGVAGPGCRVLAEPGTPADDDAAALAALGSSSSPEDDLAAALARLATAPDAPAAAGARAEALAILEGGELPGRPYDGIPLLNWNAPAKVKTVPAGGTVEVREVRFPGHAVSDAWLLDFEDPARPYTIRYRVSELGGTAGGELKLAPLLEGGIGGVHSALLPLLVPELATGTFDRSRFTDARGLLRAHESSRVAEQVVEVRMPPPGLTRAVLQPSTRGPVPALFTLQPATDRRRAAAAEAFGFAGRSPSAAERDAAIRRLAPEAPERMLWEDLRGLEVDAPSFLDAARGVGAQDGVLVDAMRTRGTLPAGTGADPEADVTLVLQNGETYVSRTSLRPAGGAVRVAIVNRDGFARRVSALALHDRRAVLGADDWGRFSWTALEGVDVAAGGSARLDLELPAGAFSLWLGDGETGDQAATMVALETGPRTQSVAPTADVGAAPLHQAIDAGGDHWVTLAGADAVVRLTPAADLAQSARSVSLIPGGRHGGTSTQPPLEPSDIAVDHRGVVWTTLALGNAIARIDPAAARDGTTAGVRVYPLPACRDEDECPAVFPREPGERLTRQPLQMKVSQDAQGNTLVWFTEANVDRIGLLRVSPDGTELGQTHFSCGCAAPLGLALDQGGDVWFTEGVSNRIGRLTPAPGQPHSAAGARLRHYLVPSALLVSEPELSPVPVLTSNPHSLAIDRRGLVWFSESATSKLGYLDPALARPGTTDGIAEIDLPRTDFGTPATPADLTVDRAGTVFWADEYGDIVGTVETSGARKDWRAGRSLRPAARRSLTDSPLVDPAGDLWFLEAGANRVTRVSGVSAGNPLVAPRPEVAVDLSADTLSVSGLAEAEALDVRVVRGGAEVARVAGVAVRGGAARVGAWPVADALRPGDVVTVQPHGRELQAAFATELPAFAARAVPGGVSGEALLGGRPLGGEVVAGDGRAVAIAADGASTADAGHTATIGADGSFRLAGSVASVTWTAATPGAAWHVRVAVAAAAPTSTPSPARPAPAPASSRSTPGGASSARPAPSGASSPAAASNSSSPRPTAPTASPQPTSSTSSSRLPSPSTTSSPRRAPASRARSCPRRWLAAARPAFVGETVAAAEQCLGRPVSRGGARRRYARGLVIEVRRGRVAAVVLTASGWTSARGELAVGAEARTVRAALPGARDGRAVVAIGAGRAADIRVWMRRGRVTRIEIRDVARTALDRAGRALLAGAA
jgi:streptogramin lyase